jgi:WbqC-like protein family
MTTVVISQPMYFPWAGFLAQISLADVLIWLDDAQFSKGSFTNRVQVKLSGGQKWMTIPLVKSGGFENISTIAASSSDWRTNHRAMLAQSFESRIFRDTALALFDEAVTGFQNQLVENIIASCEIQARHLGVLPRTILRSSQIDIGGTSWRRVLALVTKMGGTEYLTGHGAIQYLSHEDFNAHGVDVSYMEYRPLPWPQPFGPFTPFVSGLDLIASVDAEACRSHLNPSKVDWKKFKNQKGVEG